MLPGITPAQISGVHTATHRILALNSEDQLFIRWDPADGYQVEEVRFADGTLWDADTLAEKTSTELVTNRPPSVANGIADQTAHEDALFTFAVPAGSFADSDAGDSLVYTASAPDGAPLPAWLSFDASTAAFAGTPAQSDVGTVNIRVTATDTAGARASDVFALEVINVNDAPVVAQELMDQSVEVHSPFAFTVPASAFIDVDAGDSLAFSASAIVDGALPGWLSFDPATARFAGTADEIGIFGVTVRASDSSGESASSDFALSVRALADSSVSGRAGDGVIVGGTGDEKLSGGSGSDALFGDVGDDVLRGGNGSDLLQGGSGADVLRAGIDGNILDGGSGDDVIFDGSGDSFITGGAGNDTIRTGTGSDVIAFNLGDGWDTVFGGGDGGNTLSLGGGLRYSDLALSKSGDDLVVRAGAAAGMVFKDWYAGNQSVLNLQVVLDAANEFDATSSDPLYNRRLQTFDFRGLVSAFDAARAASPGVTSWALTNALLAFHLSGSDDSALGGDLAYWYGHNRSLAGMSLQAAQQVIGTPGFGSDAQALRPFTGLQEGFLKLT
jgi:Ca2+-binding RTX toxin-like protein